MNYATVDQFLEAIEGDAGLRSKVVLPAFSGVDAKRAFLQAKADAASARINGVASNHYAVPVDVDIYPAAGTVLRELCIQLMCKLLSPGFDVTATDFGAPYSAIESQMSRMVGGWRMDGTGNPKRYPPLEALPGVPRIA